MSSCPARISDHPVFDHHNPGGIFAFLGLRVLYFCLAALIQKFRFLKPALIFILSFIGVKLLLLSLPPYLEIFGLAEQKSIKIDALISLVVVLGILFVATMLSIAYPEQKRDDAKSR